MSATRRRIVRRAVMALAVIVLLVMGYVSSRLAFRFAEGADVTLPPRIEFVVDVMYEPLDDYAWSDRPGADRLYDMQAWAVGRGVKFAKGKEYVDE